MTRLSWRLQSFRTMPINWGRDLFRSRQHRLDRIRGAGQIPTQHQPALTASPAKVLLRSPLQGWPYRKFSLVTMGDFLLLLVSYLLRYTNKSYHQAS